MNILYIIPYLNPKRGGDVNVCASFAKEFSKRRHNVTIITTDFQIDLDYLHRIEENGVNIIFFKSLINIGLFLYSPAMKKWLNNNLKDYDIVHLHTYRAYQNNILHSMSKKYNVPYVVQAHGSVLPFFQKKILKKIYDYLWGYNILKDANRVIALTKMEYDQYLEMGVDKSKIKIVPNGINLSILDNLPDKGKFRSKYSIDKDKKIILYLGRIHKIKGLDILLSAFAEVIEIFNDTILVIAGPDDGFLKEIEINANPLINDGKIIITGPLYGENKFEAYIDSYIYVLPSYYESFPITVLESCTSRIPVIVTDRCGISELIQNNVGCVAKYEKDSLIKSMIKLLEDANYRDYLSRNCLNFVKSNFNLDDTIDKLEEVYKL
jgi:glycosyltransferase involved in cell wall biosynthesis